MITRSPRFTRVLLHIHLFTCGEIRIEKELIIFIVGFVVGVVVGFVVGVVVGFVVGFSYRMMVNNKINLLNLSVNITLLL